MIHVWYRRLRRACGAICWLQNLVYLQSIMTGLTPLIWNHACHFHTGLLSFKFGKGFEYWMWGSPCNLNLPCLTGGSLSFSCLIPFPSKTFKHDHRIVSTYYAMNGGAHIARFWSTYSSRGYSFIGLSCCLLSSSYHGLSLVSVWLLDSPLSFHGHHRLAKTETLTVSSL